jgi:WD40 repeat protein
MYHRCCLLLLSWVALPLIPSGWTIAAQPGPAPKAEALPPAAVTRMGTTRFRHPHQLHAVVFAPGSKVVITSDYYGRVRFWQASSGLLLRQLPDCPGTALAVPPRGELLATGHASGGIQLWDLATGRLVRTFEGRPGSSGVRALAFAPDGKTLLAAQDKGAYFWDVETGKQTALVTDQIIYAVAFSPDGKTLATGDSINYAPNDFTKPPGCKVILWDASTRKELRRFAAHHGWIYGLTFSADGQLLASASPYDACLWKVASGEKLAKLDGAYHAVAFSPVGKLLATGGAVTLWDGDKRQKVRALEEEVSYAAALAFSPDGKVLATGNTQGMLRLWSTATGKELGDPRGHQGVVRAVAFSPDGGLIASASGLDGTLRLWGVATGAQLRKVVVRAGKDRAWGDSSAKSVRFAPDGKTLALATSAGVVKLYDVVTGSPVRELAHDGAFVLGVAYSPDGNYLASSGWHESAVRIWEVSTGKLVHTIAPQGRDAEVHAVAFSPDSKLLATGSSGRDFQRKGGVDTIHLYDVASGKEVRKFRPGGYPVIHLAFTGNGKWLVSSAWGVRDSSPVEVWDVGTGKRIRGFPAPQVNDNNWRESVPIALTPDGKVLATAGADNEVVLWEMATGQKVRRLRGHKGPVTALAFAPDGHTLASGSQDTTLLLWRLAVPEDGKPAPRKPPGAKQLQACWDALADRDAAEAYRAAWALLRAGDPAVAFLKARLGPAGARDPARIPELLQQLGSAREKERAAATNELRLFGAAAEPALYEALRGKLPLAVRQQVERLLEVIADSPVPPEELQRARAVQVLEWLATPAALDLLEALGKGPLAAAQTEEAVAAAERVKARRRAKVVLVRSEEDLERARRPLPGSRPERVVMDQGGSVTAVVFAPGGRTVLTGSSDGSLVLRAADTGKELRRFTGHMGGVESATLSADGARVAAAAGDGRVWLWETVSGRRLHALKGHDKAALCVALAPDGRTLASGGADGTIRLWDVDRGIERQRIAAPAPKVTALVFTPDGKQLLSGGLVSEQNGFAGGVRFSQPAHVHVWEVSTGKLVRKLPVRGSSLALSPDGKTLLAGGQFCLIERHHKGRAFIGWGDDAIFAATQMRRYDLARGRERRLVQARGGAAAFAADGRTLLLVNGDGRHHQPFLWGTNTIGAGGDPNPGVRLIEAATGEERLSGPEQEATAAALAPDGRTLVWGRKDGALVFWDIAPEDALAAYGGKPTRADLETLWTDLGEAKPARAHAALWALTAAGKATVALLGERLKAAPPAPEVPALIAALDQNPFAKREAAERALRKLGRIAEAPLRQARKGSLSEEARRRIDDLLKRLEELPPSPAELRQLRAVHVLELIGTPEARRLLETLAEGIPAAPLTQDARAALVRLKQRAGGVVSD